MQIYVNGDKCNCCGCGACVNICAHDAVVLQKDDCGFAYPVVDNDKCVNCGLCTNACKKVNSNENGTPLQAFAATHRNTDILKKSSSGGVFSALAEHILDAGGAVCGCIFDESLNAIHICTEKKSGLFKIRKSKYLQSDVGLIYREVKSRLKTGQTVLFTGTPCQVAALYAVVGREYENLITMDLICHGVPSQLAFDKFIHYLETKYKTKITAFDFRSKKYGWQRFTMEFTDINGKTKNIGKINEFYMPAFSAGFIMRPSCFSCKYACSERVGDLTIGDFWGYEKLNLSCDTSNGTSVFTINNTSALKWLDVLSKNLLCEEIDYDMAVSGNTCLKHPTPKGEKWDMYMQAIKDDRIDDIAFRYKKSHKKAILRAKVRLCIPTPVFKLLRKIKFGR